MAPRSTPADGHQAALGLQGAHGQVLEDPFLDVLKPVVVLVEDPGCLVDVETVFGRRHPTGAPARSRAKSASTLLGALLARALELGRSRARTALRTASGSSRFASSDR